MCEVFVAMFGIIIIGDYAYYPIATIGNTTIVSYTLTPFFSVGYILH